MIEPNPNKRHFATVQMELYEEILAYLEEESLAGAVSADDVVNEALQKYFGIKTTEEQEKEKDRKTLFEHNLTRGQAELDTAIKYIQAALRQASKSEKEEINNGLLRLRQAAVHFTVADAMRE